MASLQCGLSDEFATVNSGWIPCHTHHTYSFLSVNSLMNAKVLSCNRSFSTLTTCMRLLSGVNLLMKIKVGEITKRFCHIITLRRSSDTVWITDSPAPFWLGESRCWRNSERFILESCHLVKSLAMCFQICQQESSSCGPTSEIVSISLWIFSSAKTQNSEMWTTEGSVHCFQDFTFGREYETWMNPENVQFISSFVCHMLWFACQRKPRGGPVAPTHHH